MVGLTWKYRQSRPATHESRVIKVAFGNDQLTDLSKHDLDCDYYIQAGCEEAHVEHSVGLVFEKCGSDYGTPTSDSTIITDGQGDRWHQTEGDMVVTRNDKVIAVMAASGFPSLDVMHDMMEDLEAHTTWRYLTDSTRRVVNSLNTLVAYALLLVNDVSTPSNERANTTGPAPASVQEVPGHPFDVEPMPYPRRPDGSMSGRDMGGAANAAGIAAVQEPAPPTLPRRRLITLD